MRASFFVTCVPIVVRYPSSNMLIVYRRINEVLPTALSPTRHTFDLSRFCFVIRRPRPEPRPDFDAGYLTIRALFSRLIHVATAMPSRWRTMVPRRRKRISTFSPVFAEA